MKLVCVGTERKRQLTAASSEAEKNDEEEWPMKDVVLVEDVKTVPIGKVLKVLLLLHCADFSDGFHVSVAA